jgi:predicted enzyme related to lactoylglutathione lyase
MLDKRTHRTRRLVMGMPVVHFEIGSKDLGKATAFYRELFEWDVASDDRGYGLVETRSETGIGGGLLQTPEHVPPYVTIYVGVDDIDKFLLRAEELGGTKIMGPMPIQGVGSFAMFADPDGNAIGLFEETSAA